MLIKQADKSFGIHGVLAPGCCHGFSKSFQKRESCVAAAEDVLQAGERVALAGEPAGIVLETEAFAALLFGREDLGFSSDFAADC
jgi:tRNA C32,U32 (ribose-2'-O)-methylase TrmJ